jgi:hypothetical protein
MLTDGSFLMEAKKLMDLDGRSYLAGGTAKQIEKTVTQQPEVFKGIKEILKDADDQVHPKKRRKDYFFPKLLIQQLSWSLVMNFTPMSHSRIFLRLHLACRH